CSTRNGTADSSPSRTPMTRRRPVTAVVPADHRLAAADPALPVLRAVLDPLPLVRRLAPGWGAADAQVRYLRYKPGTSLVAGLLLTHDDGATSFAQALALRPDARDKLAKVERAGAGDDVGRGAALDGALGVALTDVTADRHLPGVRRVLRHPDDTVTPLVYKPGRRWVARRDRAGSPPALVKVHRPGILPGLRAGYQAVVGLPVPPVTRVHRHRGVVVTAWVPGTSLDRLTGPATEDLWARAGELIARVHRRPPLADLTRVDRAASLAAAGPPRPRGARAARRAAAARGGGGAGAPAGPGPPAGRAGARGPGAGGGGGGGGGAPGGGRGRRGGGGGGGGRRRGGAGGGGGP